MEERCGDCIERPGRSSAPFLVQHCPRDGSIDGILPSAPEGVGRRVLKIEIRGIFGSVEPDELHPVTEAAARDPLKHRLAALVRFENREDRREPLDVRIPFGPPARCARNPEGVNIVVPERLGIARAFHEHNRARRLRGLQPP